MSRVAITKFLIIFTIIAITNILGFVNLDNLIFGGLPLFDVPIILLSIYCILTYRQILFRLNPLNSIVIVYVILTTLVIFSMPFRENESLIKAFQVGRHFYILLLVFVIEDCIYYNESSDFIKKTIYITGVYYTCIGVLLSINPNIVGEIWHGFETFAGYKGITERSGIYNNGIVFVHLAFIIKCMDILYIKKKRTVLNYCLLGYLFVGMFSMGFRAVMFALFFSLVFISFLMLRSWVASGVLSQMKLAEYVLGGILLVFVVNIALDGKVLGLAQSVVDDASYTTTTQNTFKGRINRAMKYQIPTIMQNHPYIGMGFIYKTGSTAKKYKHDPSVANAWRNLYTVDFGYGSMWAKFGIFGVSILLFTLIRAIWISYKSAREYSCGSILQLTIILLGFLITNYTWAVLDMMQGIIVMAFSIGLASEHFNEYKNVSKHLS